MTFGQLRQALSQCQDPHMEHQIRCAMMDLYNHHMMAKKHRRHHTQSPVSADEFVQLVEKQPSHQEFEEKFLPKIQEDYVNNGILNRMNSEIAIKKTKKKKTIISPYSDTGDCTYASFQSDTNIPVDDFTNTRIIP